MTNLLRWCLALRYVCPFLLIIHSSLAQSLVGNWVGVRQEIDSGFGCPLPLYLQVRADSTYTLSLLDDVASAARARWSMSAVGQLRLDTATYAASQVRLTATELSIIGAFPMRFRRVRRSRPHADPPFGEELRTLIVNRIWQLGPVRYHFHDRGQACLEQPDGSRTIRCWTIAGRDGALFLVVKGNQVDCSRNYDAPLRVLSAAPNQLVAECFDGTTTRQVSLAAGASLPPGSACTAVGFQLWSSCFYPPNEQANGLDKKGPPGQFYAIRERLAAAYKPVTAPGPTGIVQVRCQVNCEGQAGQFTTTTYGPDYQRCQLDPALTAQLLNILKTHFSTGWQPGRVRDVKRPLDYVATINIRLVDGRIVDVFP